MSDYTSIQPEPDEMASGAVLPSALLPSNHRRFDSRTRSSLSLPTPLHRRRRPIRALAELGEYEDAVKEKDLARALRFLRSGALQPTTTADQASSPSFSDWEILDTCLNADDASLVCSAYSLLQDRGLLPSFGKCKNAVLQGPREVTPAILKQSSGLEALKLSPKKWGTSGSSRLALVAFLAGVSFLLSKGIDLRPNLAATLALAGLDAVFLGGSCLAQLSCLWPPYKRRILVHEAGHLLAAYLMGCPVRGVILDPIVAVQMGIKGHAGTQFWDEKLEEELAEGRLSGNAFDRYCMVLFAGIAAEALVYGEAEGGENDENLFRSICLVLRPPWTVAQMSNQARWSVLQSYNLLKEHRKAHRAAVEALEKGYGLGAVIRRIEVALSSSGG